MATTSEDLCPLCLYNWHDVARPAQCEHRFCFDCIEQGAKNKAECPDCRRRARIIQHLLWGQPFEEDAAGRPPAADLGKAQGEAPHEARGASQEHQEGKWDAEDVGGLHAMDWGRLFQNHPDLLQLLQPWLHQELGRIFEEEPPLAVMLEEMVLGALPVYGLHEGHLVELLRPNMGICTIVFVQGFLKFTAEQLRRPAHQLLLQDECRAASRTEESPGGDVSRSAIFTWRRDHSPEATTSWAAHQESQEGYDVVRSTSAGFYKRGEVCLLSTTGWAAVQGGWEISPRASTSSTALRGRQWSPTACPSPTASQGGTPAPQPAPSAAQAKELQSEPGVAAAGASARRRGRRCSPRRPRRPLKRKASSSQDSAVPNKKPPRQGC